MTYQRFHVHVRQIVLVGEIKGFRVHLAGAGVHARLLQVTVLTNRQTHANTVHATRLRVIGYDICLVKKTWPDCEIQFDVIFDDFNV